MALVIIAIAVLVLLYWAFLSPSSQVFGQMTYRVRTSERLVALTFDDGPNEPYTSHLLDVLERQKIKATFFVVGRNVRRHPEVIRRAAKAGHTIGNHSLSHRFANYFVSPSFETEIAGGQAAIAEVIGQQPKLFRSPWLFRSPSLLGSVKRAGLVPISGVFGHSLEIFQPSATAMARTAYRKTKPGSIIILHDGYDAKGGRRNRTVQATELLIESLKIDGYRFVTVDELLKIKPYQTD